MEYLQNLAGSTQFPLVTALILGLMTAISPCPMATNIAAIGFIGKDLQSRRRIFTNGLLYTLGRTASYTLLGIVLIVIIREGSSIFNIQRVLGTYGELVIGPLLITIGMFMLGFIRIRFLGLGRTVERMQNRTQGGNPWHSLALGVVFALAFCPYSGVLYFGALIPLAVSTSYGYLLPVVFALATALPVILFAWVLAFSVSSVGNMYNRIRTFERWFRRVAGVVFIVAGLYYLWMVYL